MWSVILSPDAQSFLGKQDKQIGVRLRKGLKKLECNNPFHFLEHFEGEDHYKFRIGDYRALIDIDFSQKLIKIQVLDHRSVIYKRYKQ
jgi:mRNA-degrading endonuclease RelE of RelBE toxin-antitoxin system